MNSMSNWEEHATRLGSPRDILNQTIDLPFGQRKFPNELCFLEVFGVRLLLKVAILKVSYGVKNYNRLKKHNFRIRVTKSTLPDPNVQNETVMRRYIHLSLESKHFINLMCFCYRQELNLNIMDRSKG